MTAREELRIESRRILAKHGKADFTCSFVIHKKTGIKPYRNIIDTVCKFYNIEFDDITVKGRLEPYAHVRQVICYLLFFEAGLNKDAIADIINRDRTIIYYYIKHITGIAEYDKNLFDEIDLLRGLIENANHDNNS